MGWGRGKTFLGSRHFNRPLNSGDGGFLADGAEALRQDPVWLREELKKKNPVGLDMVGEGETGV